MAPSEQISSPQALFERVDEFARQNPTTAVVSAFGAGLLINVLPFGTILTLGLSLFFSLLRPALLFLGVLKAFEILRDTTLEGRAE